jgi:hypothetical protein
MENPHTSTTNQFAYAKLGTILYSLRFMKRSLGIAMDAHAKGVHIGIKPMDGEYHVTACYRNGSAFSELCCFFCSGDTRCSTRGQILGYLLVIGYTMEAPRLVPRGTPANYSRVPRDAARTPTQWELEQLMIIVDNCIGQIGCACVRQGGSPCPPVRPFLC